MAPLVTLTTDFGARDPYVAEMKAVILGLNPAVRFIDVTHEVAVREDSAAARLHGRRGTRVILSRSRTSRGPRRARS